MTTSSLGLIQDYIAPSGWWQHVPVAHWLVAELKPSTVVELGTHYGVSFFSFCEAARAFSPSTFVYAVDTWEGDEHASYYANDVFEKVQSHWEKAHRCRSRLIRSTFDEAVNYFADDSIDILHIDGLHTYEAVKHDFETWLPKMKENSLILFHDINVRERGFGVWQLWEELKSRHSTREVPNGHGLGLLILGKEMEICLNAFTDLVEAFQAKGELLEKVAQLTPGGDFSIHPLEQARAETEQAKAEAQQARAETEQAKAELTRFRKSRFWALTKPARKTLDLLKSIFRAS